MNKPQNDLLKKVLISGTFNVEKSEQIKKEIFDECGMDSKNSRDRANWSNWINGRSKPNRFYGENINKVLNRYQIEPIYDYTTNH